MLRPSKNGRKDTPTVPSFSTERKGSLHRRRRSTAAQGAGGGTRWVTMLGALIALLATVYLARLQMAPTAAAAAAAPTPA